MFIVEGAKFSFAKRVVYFFMILLVAQMGPAGLVALLTMHLQHHSAKGDTAKK